MKYFRIHTGDIASVTGQPRGLFAAIGKLVNDHVLTEEELKEYEANHNLFEKILPVPPFYDNGNSEKAITWFKDTPEGKSIYSKMTFYRKMAEKYDLQLYQSECDEIPGEVIYEDEYQIAIKNQKTDLGIKTYLI